MKTLYRIIAIIILAPFVAGSAMFIAAFIALVSLIGCLYDAQTTAELPRPDE